MGAEKLTFDKSTNEVGMTVREGEGGIEGGTE